MNEFIPPPQKKGTAKKIFLLVFLLFLTGIIGLFAWKFVSILYTMRYGNTETKQELLNKVAPSFTLSEDLIQNAAEKSPSIDAEKYIHPENPSFGPKSAPIQIIAFIDFECPFCQKSFPIFKEMTEKYDGAVRVVFKHFPIASIHKNAIPSAIASTCADEQKQFWAYHDILFQTKNLSEEGLLFAADKLQMNIFKFQNCLKNETYKETVVRDLNEGIEIGVRGTPTFVVQNKKYEGVLTLDQWENIILKHIRK